MNNRNNNCQTVGPKKTINYSTYLKPIFAFILSTLLALSVTHWCEKYSNNNSFEKVRSDLISLRNNLNLLLLDVRESMETKDEYKKKFMEVSCIVPKLSEAILQLRSEIVEGMDVQAKKLLKTAGNIRDMIKTELQFFNDDYNGKTDFALETLGGTIVSIRDTKTYDGGAAYLSIMGMAVCAQQNNPRAIIQAKRLPGECWAIEGNQGVAVIQLIGFVKISGFTIEHISQSVSATGETSTAPRDFSVFGLNNIDDENGFLFGDYRYDNTKSPSQYFPVQNENSKSYELVELKIHSNSGNDIYTCIYRFKVHGILTSFARGIS